jgi:hypothetical protein
VTNSLPMGRWPKGTKEDPFALILHESVEPYAKQAGVNEGDVIPLPHGWWRIVYSRRIPEGA